MGAQCTRSSPGQQQQTLPYGAPAPVILNIYNVGTSDKVNFLNRLLRPFGAGAFHCGVEVYGQEWSYGDYDEGTGVFACSPRLCEGHTYCESVSMGRTIMSEDHFMRCMKALEVRWMGRDYDILERNCCHFCEEVLALLRVACVPQWVTNLASAAAALKAAGEVVNEKRRSIRNPFALNGGCCGCDILPPNSGKQVEIISATPARQGSLHIAAERGAPGNEYWGDFAEGQPPRWSDRIRSA
mmetsp:Transcript_23646/g.51721  ORF Transcript_23646/g.51721 Transcript_23646/m.51721 type:complete len:241 (-) Transcript_23646:35-757(-)